jgi:hypothetical protein
LKAQPDLRGVLTLPGHADTTATQIAPMALGVG